MSDPKRTRRPGARTEPRRRVSGASSSDNNPTTDGTSTARVASSPNNSDKRQPTTTPNTNTGATSNDPGGGGWSFFSLLSCWLGSSDKKQAAPVAGTTVTPKKIETGSVEAASPTAGDESDRRRVARIGEVPKPPQQQQRDTDNDAPDLKSPEKGKSQERAADPTSATMISVNPDDSDMPEFIAPELLAEANRAPAINIRELFDREVVTHVSTEVAMKPKCKYNQVSFARAQTVYMLPPTRQRLHKKIIRSRHDAWRRHGALTMIHQLGGWSYTIQGKNKVYTKIAKGTQLPPPPTAPPIMTEEEFHKRPIITMPAGSKDGKSRRQRNRNNDSKKAAAKAADSDTTVSDDDPPSC
uniref:Similar to n=1 Tax=Panagrellus redivivus TaxID=6233 RepID=A0A7E4UW43_PANRE